jgi:hypothetical protein
MKMEISFSIAMLLATGCLQLAFCQPPDASNQSHIYNEQIYP